MQSSRRASSSTQLTARLYPSSPVAAFALPELTRIAFIFSELIWLFDKITGAAQHTFFVKTPAGVAGLSETITAKSSADFFMPQFVADVL